MDEKGGGAMKAGISRKPLIVALLVVVTALTLVHCRGSNKAAPAPNPGPTGVVIAAPSAAAPPSTPEPVAPPVTAEPVVDAPATALPPAKPVRITIPRINARSSLVHLGLERDGTLEVPPVSTPLQAGWYTEGPTPGEVGPALIVGHVDGAKKPGIFYRLRELAPGDEVLVEREDGITARFVVTDKQQVAKTHFPTEQVFGDTDDAQLRLITCGGAFDRSSQNYLDNIIVYAGLMP